MLDMDIKSVIKVANIILEILQESLNNVFSGIEQNDEDIANSMIEKAKANELEIRTRKVNLTKVDKKWQIKSDNDIMALVFKKYRVM